MHNRIAHKTIEGKLLHFVLVEECYSDNDEPFTLFINENHYSADRKEWKRLFFDHLNEALIHCKQKYGIEENDWVEEPHFAQSFSFEFGVTNLGIPQPYLINFDNGQVIFKLGQRVISEEDPPISVLNICGDPEGLRRLAALLLLCAESEQYDEGFHIHLEDIKDFTISDLPITLRGPSFFDDLRKGEWREGRNTSEIVE